jgi:hypothetical protein
MFLNGQTPGEYWRFNDLATRLDVLRAYPVHDLTWLGLALAGGGLLVCAMGDRAVAAYFAIVLAFNALIVVTYSIHNIYNYLTPGYAVLCVLIGVACARIGAFVRDAGWGDASEPAPFRSSADHARLGFIVSALFLLLPLALVARNYGSVDRSDDYAAYDVARTTMDRLPPRAVVMTDSWTAPPLWYVQLVEGDRRDVFVTPIFSSPGEDPVAFARDQLDGGRPVYVADGLHAPTSALRDEFVLQPVLLNGIETMVTDALPKPEYRDDLVARGTLYKLLESAPTAHVDGVPRAASRDVPFDAQVTLVGFEREGDLVDGGSVIRLTYYWRADRDLEAIPSAVTLFSDSDGHVASNDGWPAWQQSRPIGEGIVDDGEWHAGDVISESYFTLVPRGTPPGTYQVRIAVFDASSDAAHAGAQAEGSLVTIGEITVR